MNTDQIKNNWFDEVKQINKKHKVSIKKGNMKTKTKTQWKNETRKKIEASESISIEEAIKDRKYYNTKENKIHQKKFLKNINRDDFSIIIHKSKK